jgi:hypothetical protein
MIYLSAIFVGVVILIYAVHRYDRYLEKQIKEWEEKSIK